MKKILYAEDEFSNRLLVQDLLENNGYECITVETASKCIETLENDDSFCLLIIDYYLPDMNANELLEKIKKLGINKPIFIITSDDDLYDKLDNNIIKEIIIKPINFDELLEKIHNLLPC